MQSMYECRVSYDKNIDGKMKKVTESYLVDAVTFTDAEATLIKEVCNFLGSEYNITNIKKAKFTEIFDSEREIDDRWYNCRIAMITLDEDKGIEKEVKLMNLVKGENLETALSHFKIGMKDTMCDYRILSVAESPILDYIKYNSDERITQKINAASNSAPDTNTYYVKNEAPQPTVVEIDPNEDLDTDE